MLNQSPIVVQNGCIDFGSIVPYFPIYFIKNKVWPYLLKEEGRKHNSAAFIYYCNLISFYVGVDKV